MVLIQRIKNSVQPGRTIIRGPKGSQLTVVRWGQSRGQEALVYSIPNRKVGGKPYTKRITVVDFQDAHKVLMQTGEFTKSWFKEKLPYCAKVGDCNFIMIGGIFGLLGDAWYCRPGVYCKKSSTTVKKDTP
jgi:hypothetical protein